MIEEVSSKLALMDEEELDDAALKFAKVIVESDIKISVASIQGYLLLHKMDPTEAVDKAAEWVNGIGAGAAKSTIDGGLQ